LRGSYQIFPEANTIVAIEDGKLLKKFEYEILFSKKGLQATLDELNQINYFRTYKIAEENNYGELLDILMKSTFELMKSISPIDLIWRVFALYYDIHNIKLAAKERFLRKRLDELFLDYGSYPMQTIRSATVTEADDILENPALTRGLFEALGSAEMYDIDFILDKTYFKALKNYSTQFNIKEIEEFVTERIDLYNVSAFLQSIAAKNPEGYFERAFSDCGSSALEEWQPFVHGNREDFSDFSLWKKYEPLWIEAESRQRLFDEFDVLRDNYLINRTKMCKLISFGVEPICAYFYNKLMEIKNIRILLTGKERDYAATEITKRVRAPYEL